METNSYEPLQKLAADTIESLKKAKQPIVRVCGPLTTGGFGYDENARRLEKAEQYLEEHGHTVFKFGDSEAHIKGKNYEYNAVMEQFHQPILQSGLISEAYFLPGWEQSRGTTWERNFIKDHTTIVIKEFPEEWLQ